MFLIRRTVAALVVLLLASYLVYVLSAISGSPLAALQQTHAPNKAELIRQTIALLHLDVPPPLRYFIWFGGLLGVFTGNFSLGNAVNGLPVTSELASAIGVTLQLVFAATIIAIVVGILVGITTALRQYSTYDYVASFFSFLFFSLPIFALAVMLKQFGAIGFNNFLLDPTVSVSVIVVLTIVAALAWPAIVGGSLRQRLVVGVVAGLATLAALIYISATKWLLDPSLGIVVVTLLCVGVAAIMTVLSTGWSNKKSRNSALSVAALVLVLYYPLEGGLFNVYGIINTGTIILFGLIFIAICGGIGYAWGGVDRWLSVRTAALTGTVAYLILLFDRFTHSWNGYVTQVTNGRPIATIGSATPDLQADFWITGVDNFTHLLLPTIALCLISIAGYSRYSRASLLDVMNQDYIRTARAKGLTERTVVVRHAFRNALIPITTIITLDFGALIGGAVITETVFSWSGMGNLFQAAIIPDDLNTIMGVFLVTGITAVLFNIVADLIYSALDPRIRVTA